MKRSILDIALSVLEIEIESLTHLKSRLDESFSSVVHLILACKGKVVVAGMGKSGHIGRKIASTLSSTGTPAVFLHPAESSHGDLGLLSPQDLVLAISYSGKSFELENILKYCKRESLPVVAMTGNKNSFLAKSSTFVLDISVKKEACPLGLAPTSSSIVTLALGDALAMSLLSERGFKEADFASRHPGGSLGRQLLLCVSDVMHTGRDIPTVKSDATLQEALFEMSQKPVRGIVAIVDAQNQLLGVVTDGDLRRQMESGEAISEKQVGGFMSQPPVSIRSDELVQKALSLMEEYKVQSLFVLDESSGQSLVGLVHFQDLLSRKVL